MEQYFRKRVLKIGTTVILAEVLVLALVGLLYVSNISYAVDRRVELQVQLPGKLMNAGFLDYDSIQDIVQMNELVGRGFMDGMVIGVDYNVYYSLNPAYIGQKADDIPGFDTSVLNVQNPNGTLIYTDSNLLSVSIIYSLDETTPRFFVYVVVDTSEAIIEKNQSTLAFIASSSTVVVLTIAIVVLSGGLIKKLEDDLTQKERLAVLGELGAGVDHEIRNPLSVVKASAYLLRITLDKPNSEVSEIIDTLEKESIKIEQIVDSLLRFAHPKVPIMVSVDLSNTTRDTLSEIKIPDNVSIVTEFATKLPMIRADCGQLSIIITNIITNALQAMPKGGQLRISTTTDSSKWVILSIADTGIGIPSEDIEKLFQPLFTTKAQGIGLGLPITKVLVEGHNGVISVESELSKGTTVTIKFPISQSHHPNE
ncbi:MAG: hypothetical protein E4H14_20335 [Candidatus Thorarchaeota archaeon]|nr:MAG: hypothetical protein E4H14_20335 [Candidatus Thorarchaeota archaeon]